MIVFLDFEASSLGKRSFPVEVGWVTEDGSEERHLIRPAPDWEEWSEEAEGIHGFSRETLEREGEPHDAVARRMVAVLTGHDLYASAPSWDGQWLSRLLRAAGLPRHALRLRDTEEIQRQAALAALEAAGTPPEQRAALAEAAVADVTAAAKQAPPAHRAVEDARREWQIWRDVGRRAAGQALGR